MIDRIYCLAALILPFVCGTYTVGRYCIASVCMPEKLHSCLYHQTHAVYDYLGYG